MTRFSVVRYGNVIGSRGSIIPFSRSLIAGGAKDQLGTRRIFCHVVTRRDARGEIFESKILSMKVMDLVEAIAPGMETEIIGIRRGGQS